MYTVLRFVADSTCSDAALCELGRRLNGIRGVVFDRLDRRGHRFSISISSDEEWSVHAESLRDFVQNASSVIADAKRMGVTVEADAAIGPEDLRGKPYLSCNIPSATLKELEQNGVELTFTVYAPS
jgi:hypothetical protein